LFASVEKIIIADDKAQRLFDNCFQVLNGPDAPDLSIQELDRELILKLSYRPSSNNYQFSYREKDPLITVDPSDVDSVLAINPNYFDYVFEGFQIFQMANKDVSISDIYDPTQSRLVAQCDVKNGITQLINWNIDPNLNQLVPQDMTLQANNQGVFTSFRILEDAFAIQNRNLINNKEYHFTVLAYGQNQFQVFQPTSAPGGQRIPFLAGRRNILTYTAIPHITDPRFNGTILNAQYGDGPEITRIEGVGNGGQNLELKPETSEQILMAPNFSVQFPTYAGGAGPVRIQVVDPVAIPSGDFILAFDGVTNSARWTITDLATGLVIADSDTTIAFFGEQIIPELGLSVLIEQQLAPGGDEEGTRNNGVLISDIIYDNPSQAWWQGVTDDKSFTPLNWILAGTNDNATAPPASWYRDIGGDPKSNFERIINGTWGPAAYVSAINRRSEPQGEVYGMGPMPVGVQRPLIAEIHSVDVVLTADKSKWTRVPVFEMSEDALLAEGGAAKLSLRKDTSYSIIGGEFVHDLSLEQGWSYFPGYAIDVETGQRLNMAFGENSFMLAQNGNDMRWNPTNNTFIAPPNSVHGSYVFGGQHYIYVFAPTRRQGLNFVDISYKGDNPTDNPMYSSIKAVGPNQVAPNNIVFGNAMWVSIPLLRDAFRFDPHTNLPTTTRFRLRTAAPYARRVTDNSNAGNPKFQFNTSSIATQTGVASVATSALDLIRVVPNPYYGFSRYETSQLDNIVKITNLPPRCNISIYSTSGTLIRQIRKDNSDTWVPWDLKNQYNVPIASGVYIIHIDAGAAGEKVVKWFGSLRPVDLNAF
jgi:hypothetical protein